MVKLANMTAKKKERQASCEITPSSFIQEPKYSSEAKLKFLVVMGSA